MRRSLLLAGGVAALYAPLVLVACGGHAPTAQQRTQIAFAIDLAVEAAIQATVTFGVPPAIADPIHDCGTATRDAANAFAALAGPVEAIGKEWGKCDQQIAQIKGLNPQVAAVFQKIGDLLASL